MGNTIKKILVILFFLPFFIAQNIHYLGYVHCRVVNAVQDSGKKCDCEEALGKTIKAAAQNSPVSNDIHIHAHLDSYFRHAVRQVFEALTPGNHSEEMAGRSWYIATGYLATPWRPPAIIS